MATRQIKALLYDVYDNNGSVALNPTVPIVDSSGGFPVSAATGTIFFDNAGITWWRNGNSWVQISASPAEIQLSSVVPVSAVAGTVILDSTLQKPVWYTGSKWATLGTVASSSSSYVPSTSDTRIVSWFDAKSLASIKLSTTLVTAANIPNKITGGSALTFGSGTQPTYKANWKATTGYDVSGLYISAVANSWIQIPFSVPSTTEFSVIMACSMDTKDGGGWFSAVRSDNTAQITVNKNRLLFNIGFYGGGSVAFTIPSPYQPCVFVIQISSKTFQLSINGNFMHVNVSGNMNVAATLSSLRLFNSIVGTEPHTGHLYEIICLNKAIDDTERLMMEGYLAHKWKFNNNLIVGHPYRSNPPTV